MLLALIPFLLILLIASERRKPLHPIECLGALVPEKGRTATEIINVLACQGILVEVSELSRVLVALEEDGLVTASYRDVGNGAHVYTYTISQTGMSTLRYI